MPDQIAGRDEATQMVTRPGGNFYVALNGPTGEATCVNIGMEDPFSGDVLVRRFTVEQVDDIVTQLNLVAGLLREGK